MIINEHGRSFSELDALKWQAAIHTSFVLKSREGISLCGRHVIGDSEATIYVDPRWHKK